MVAEVGSHPARRAPQLRGVHSSFEDIVRTPVDGGARSKIEDHRQLIMAHGCRDKAE